MPKSGKRRQQLADFGASGGRPKAAKQQAQRLAAENGGAASSSGDHANLQPVMDDDEQRRTIETDEMMDEECSTGGLNSSCDVQLQQAFDVGGDELVVGVQDDPVGLVGCEIVIRWDNENSRCLIDAYAPDAPDEPCYIISWVSEPNEYHLYTRIQMAEAGVRCSSSVKVKLEGRPRRHLRRVRLRGRRLRRRRRRVSGACVSRRARLCPPVEERNLFT